MFILHEIFSKANRFTSLYIDFAHFKDKQTIVETNETTEVKEKATETGELNSHEDWQDSSNIPGDWQLRNHKDLRPKLHDKIEFMVQGCLKDGVVTKVGKKSGKDKNRCWIKENDSEYSYAWRKTKKSNSFKHDSKEFTSPAVKDDDEIDDTS